MEYSADLIQLLVMTNEFLGQLINRHVHIQDGVKFNAMHAYESKTV